MTKSKPRSPFAEQRLTTARQALRAQKLAPEITRSVDALLVELTDGLDARHCQALDDLRNRLRQTEFTVDQMGEVIQSLMAK